MAGTGWDPCAAADLNRRQTSDGGRRPAIEPPREGPAHARPHQAAMSPEANENGGTIEPAPRLAALDPSVRSSERFNGASR